VLGNGDVTDTASAIRMFEETGCDGILIGRAAQGNPWVFSQIVRGLKKADEISALRENQCDASTLKENRRNFSILGKNADSTQTANEISNSKSEIEKPTRQQVKEMIYRHLDLLEKHKGEYIAVREMRKHVAWYTAGYPHSAAIRGEINYAENKSDLVNIIEKFWG